MSPKTKMPRGKIIYVSPFLVKNAGPLRRQIPSQIPCVLLPCRSQREARAVIKAHGGKVSPAHAKLYDAAREMVLAYKQRFGRSERTMLGPIDTEYEALSKLINGSFPTP